MKTYFFDDELVLPVSLGEVFGFFAEARNLEKLTVADAVEIDRYLGEWYEIASYPAWFQRNCTAVTARYSLRDDGLIEVINSCRKGSLEGKLKQVTGRAKVVDSDTNAKLKVSFFAPFWGKYWIIDLDQGYQWAVVGEPKRKYLWILSRTPSMDDDIYQQILARLPDKGYDPDGLQRTVQPNPRAESEGADQ
jgi:apolipoprotein D and lipocalin family protein